MPLASVNQLNLIGSFCSNLVKFGGDFDDCGHYSNYTPCLSDVGILHLQSCQYLKEFSISKINIAFTNDTIIQCLRWWPNLLHLDLSFTTSRINNGVFEELGKHANLISLNLGGDYCDNVSDSGLRELAVLQQLKNLVLINFSSISQAAMVDVISNLSNLETLHLGGTPVGGMPLLKAIRRSCQKIVSLTVDAGAENLSYAYLVEFVAALPNLLYYYVDFDLADPSSDDETVKKDQMQAILRARNPSNKDGEDFGYVMVSHLTGRGV